MTEHKTDMNITKQKKLNMTEQKIGMTNLKKTEQQFYDRAQNRDTKYKNCS